MLGASRAIDVVPGNAADDGHPKAAYQLSQLPSAYANDLVVSSSGDGVSNGS